MRLNRNGGNRLTLTWLISLALTLAVRADSSLDSALRQLQQPAQRVKALQRLSRSAFSLRDAAGRGRVCQALLKRLKQGKNPLERRQLARVLESYLSHAQTPSACFGQAEFLLVDADEGVRHPIWLAFSQRASQPHLSARQDERLLTLARRGRKEVRLEALNWANEAAQQRAGLARLLLPVELQLSDDPDEDVRNLAIYGCFEQLERAPEQVTEVARKHLSDSKPATRSMVMDFLQQGALRDDKLCQLQPAVLERFGHNPPPEERFQLAVVAANMGPLPSEVWTYLQEDAVKTVSLELLLNLARTQGRAARPLLAQLLNAQNLELGADVLAECGLPDSLVGPVVMELQRRHLKNSGEKSSQTASLLLSLIDRPQAEVAEAFLSSQDPQVLAAAAYLVGRHQLQRPAALQAAHALSEVDWKIAFKGGTTMLAALDRLRAVHKFELARMQGTQPDVDLLLGWLLGQESARVPDFVEDYARGTVFNARVDPGVTSDVLILEMKWIGAHSKRICEPGLRRLLYHWDEKVREQARASLEMVK